MVLLLACASASAEVRVENRQGVSLPLGAMQFVDEDGRTSPLERYFGAGRPVVLALVYYGCSGVCSVLLNSWVETMTLLGVTPGKDFELLVVSINPDETAALAKKKKAAYLKLYSHPETAKSWHFLTGKPQAIAELTSLLGFEYERDPESGIFRHPSALFFLTQKGTLSSEMIGLRFPRDQVKSALNAAAAGKSGSFFDQLLTYCGFKSG